MDTPVMTRDAICRAILQRVGVSYDANTDYVDEATFFHFFVKRLYLAIPEEIREPPQPQVEPTQPYLGLRPGPGNTTGKSSIQAAKKIEKSGEIPKVPREALDLNSLQEHPMEAPNSLTYAGVQSADTSLTQKRQQQILATEVEELKEESDPSLLREMEEKSEEELRKAEGILVLHRAQFTELRKQRVEWGRAARNPLS